jgi:hypothetical protein
MTGDEYMHISRSYSAMRIDAKNIVLQLSYIAVVATETWSGRRQGLFWLRLRWFLSVLQAYAGTGPQIRSRSSSSTLFPVHHSLTIVSCIIRWYIVWAVFHIWVAKVLIDCNPANGWKVTALIPSVVKAGSALRDSDRGGQSGASTK